MKSLTPLDVVSTQTRTLVDAMLVTDSHVGSIHSCDLYIDEREDLVSSGMGKRRCRFSVNDEKLEGMRERVGMVLKFEKYRL